MDVEDAVGEVEPSFPSGGGASGPMSPAHSKRGVSADMELMALATSRRDLE